MKFCTILIRIRYMMDDDDEDQSNAIENFDKLCSSLYSSPDKDVREVTFILYIYLINRII